MAPGASMLSPLPEPYTEQEEEVIDQGPSFPGGILHVRIHDAQGIHNICIYDNQDVFAKFSFTHGKAEPFSTQVVTKGGRNPVFNECFQLPVTLPNSVLKCEMWMSSRAHSYLEDQLLGFVLVPISTLATKPVEAPEEYGLSSTELFHSPAGVVRLTLAFLACSQEIEVPDADHSETNSPLNGSPPLHANGKHKFIKVFDDGSNNGGSSGTDSPPCYESEEPERVEFPDLQAASEDRLLVSSYLEMSSENRNRNNAAGIITGPVFLLEGKTDGGGSFREDTSDKEGNSSSTCNSVSELASLDEQSDNGSSGSKQTEKSSSATGTFKSLGMQKQDSALSSLSQESAGMKQQIVDIYMKSMQQFTEALAKMQLPLDLDKAGCDSSPNAKKSKSLQDTENKKNVTGKSHRVFYGSRAFF